MWDCLHGAVFTYRCMHGLYRYSGNAPHADCCFKGFAQQKDVPCSPVFASKGPVGSRSSYWAHSHTAPLVHCAAAACSFSCVVMELRGLLRWGLPPYLILLLLLLDQHEFFSGQSQDS